MRLFACLALIWAALATAGPVAAQPIVQSTYRPPETVQRVAVPANPVEERLDVLIISGENSYEHDWTGVNNRLRTQLLDTGRFDVRVTEDFDEGTLAMLQDYDVVILNYSSRWNYADTEQHLWSPAAFQALYDYVAQGGGLVAYHSSFTWGRDIPEYHRLVGATMMPGVSRRAPPDAFQVQIVQPDHPITRGLRPYHWMFMEDMYTNMQFHPDARVEVLASAYEDARMYDPDNVTEKYPPEAYSPERVAAMPGMNSLHPMVWVQSYGRGRVFSITLGHGPDTIQYDGFRTLFARGAEWAATGEVTLPALDKAVDYRTTAE